MIHKAKKSLGQNFLKSELALQKICEAGEVTIDDTILEIGPGKGALTTKLLEKAGCVFAIEKDLDLINILKEKFENKIKNKKLILIDGDVLDLEISNFIKNKNYKIIANIPYNITGAILKKFLSENKQPEKMALLVQKEVAERIVTRDNKESILSLSVKAYGTPKYIMKVHKRFFSPEPKVDSAIILIDKISRNNFKNKDEEKLFFEIVKAGFSHKRKVLIKNLETLKIDRDQIKNIFENLKLNIKTRAEDVPFEKWFQMINKISKF